VAAAATIYTFDIELSDVDRGVYETLTIRLARHPSETAEYLVTRLLAYCLEYTQGIEFSKGLSDPDEPAISVRDLTGTRQAWIEVGVPDAARLHKAAKTAPTVIVYPHRDVEQLLARLAHVLTSEELTVATHGPSDRERGAAPEAPRKPRNDALEVDVDGGVAAVIDAAYNQVGRLGQNLRHRRLNAIDRRSVHGIAEKFFVLVVFLNSKRLAERHGVAHTALR